MKQTRFLGALSIVAVVLFILVPNVLMVQRPRQFYLEDPLHVDERRRLVGSLVEEMSESWKPVRYKDTYHDDLMRLINKRIKAGKTEVVTAPDKGEAGEGAGRAKVVDLMALLKRSVQRYGQPKRHVSKRERQASRKTA